MQGVSLRMNILSQAQKFGVKGWVKNSTSENVVDALLQGEERKINLLLDYIKSNPFGARIEEIKVNEIKTSEKFVSFEIRY